MGCALYPVNQDAAGHSLLQAATTVQRVKSCCITEPFNSSLDKIIVLAPRNWGKGSVIEVSNSGGSSWLMVWASDEPGWSCSHVLGGLKSFFSLNKLIPGKAVGHVWRIIMPRQKSFASIVTASVQDLQPSCLWKEWSSCDWYLPSLEMLKVYVHLSIEFGFRDFDNALFPPTLYSRLFWILFASGGRVLQTVHLPHAWFSVPAADRWQCPVSIPVICVKQQGSSSLYCLLKISELG